MLKVFLDTNVLLDYAGVSCLPADHDNAMRLMTLLCSMETPFLVTPTQVKDFHFIAGAALKKLVREEKGLLTEEDSQAISFCVLQMAEAITAIGCVASEGMNDCETARILCRQHNDYEDNLVAAVALRSNADYVITRDRAFSAHCPVACLTPADAIAYLESEIIL